MDARFTLVAAVAFLGCAPPVRAPQCVSPPPVAVNVPPASAPILAEAKPAEATSPCFQRGRPAEAKKTDAFEFCAPFDAAELARVEAKVRADFQVHERPSKLVVDFGCDKAFGSIKEVVLEDGSGHGGSLRFHRFVHDGDVMRVRTIESSHYYEPGMKIRAGEIPASTIEKMIASARVAMLAKPHLVTLIAPDGSLGLSGFSSSSNDFHLRLRIVDDEGRATDRAFTGYDGSMSQDVILPMRMATEPFWKLVATLHLRDAQQSEDDARFFTERFVASMAAHPAWWVKERMVALASKLGTVDAVPALVAIANEKGEASADRTREPALDAIAAITGWDPRVDVYTGKKLDVDAAAARASRECR